MSALLPEVITVRALVLFVVVMLAVVLLLPTARAYLSQRSELASLRSQLASDKALQAQLDNELARWKDKNYVIREARDHLNFIMPGDTPWRIVDTGEDPGDKVETTAGVAGTGAIVSHDEGTDWYQAMWDSIAVADRAKAGTRPAPEPSPTSSPTASTVPTSGATP